MIESIGKRIRESVAKVPRNNTKISHHLFVGNEERTLAITMKKINGDIYKVASLLSRQQELSLSDYKQAISECRSPGLGGVPKKNHQKYIYF